MTLQVGQRVECRGGHLATVVSVEPCGWGRCIHPDCVTVREDRWQTTTNHPASWLQPVPGPTRP